MTTQPPKSGDMPDVIWIDLTEAPLHFSYEQVDGAQLKYHSDRKYQALLKAAEGMEKAVSYTKAEFKRLKDALMDRQDIGFIEKMRDAVYLDAVMDVIDTKTEQSLTDFNKLKGENND
jgi:hypothetical protein